MRILPCILSNNHVPHLTRAKLGLWYSLFPANHILAVQSEQVFRNTTGISHDGPASACLAANALLLVTETMREVFDFLQLPAFRRHCSKSNCSKVYNSGKDFDVMHMLSSADWKSFGLEPPSANIGRSAIPEISAGDKTQLVQLRKFYEPHNRKLYDLIGRDFDW
jgi:hypothetical protein